MKLALRRTSRNAFTLMEIMVVVIILGILSTMALTQYNKLWQHEEMRQAIIAGKTLHALNAMYYARNNEYIAENEALTDIYDINDAFGTSFPNKSPKIKFSYLNGDFGSKFVLTFIRFYPTNSTDPLYEFQFSNVYNDTVTPLGDDNPSCIDGTQPCPDLSAF